MTMASIRITVLPVFLMEWLAPLPVQMASPAVTSMGVPLSHTVAVPSMM